MFDYIIVGAGSAGCVLAHRLSADPRCQVLLLEAGESDRTLMVRVPAAFSKLFHSRRDWAFFTEPESQFANRRLYVPRGRMLGGSSSMNAMIYIRGNRRDYEEWGSLSPGWAYEEVLPYFRRSQDQERGEDHYHGVGGPMTVADPAVLSELSHGFVQAAVEAGMEPNSDFNGVQQRGAGFYQLTQRDGRRWSAADAFLRPALRRPNLTVWSGAQATRVLWDGEAATGVEYRRKGKLEVAFCQGEVVLSAGAIQSPQLLMLSGVGPTSALERHGITVQTDSSEVGKNLQDHPVVGVAYGTPRPTDLQRAERLPSLLRYLVTGGGALASNVAEAGAFTTVGAGEAAPDLQFHFAPVVFEDHQLLPSVSGFTMGPTLVAPRSRGAVELQSAEADEPPRIVSGQLRESNDVERLIDGIELAREIAHQPALRPLWDHEYRPGETATGRRGLTEFLRDSVELLYHPVGTCRMGGDSASVVDPQLRVRGVRGLRVADASVMPTIVRGNTHAPTVMIAEKAAAMILREQVASTPRASRAPSNAPHPQDRKLAPTGS